MHSILMLETAISTFVWQLNDAVLTQDGITLQHTHNSKTFQPQVHSSVMHMQDPSQANITLICQH
jgi:hypothetical protein